MEMDDQAACATSLEVERLAQEQMFAAKYKHVIKTTSLFTRANQRPRSQVLQGTKIGKKITQQIIALVSLLIDIKFKQKEGTKIWTWNRGIVNHCLIRSFPESMQLVTDGPKMNPRDWIQTLIKKRPCFNTGSTGQYQWQAKLQI